MTYRPMIQVCLLVQCTYMCLIIKLPYCQPKSSTHTQKFTKVLHICQLISISITKVSHISYIYQQLEGHIHNCKHACSKIHHRARWQYRPMCNSPEQSVRSTECSTLLGEQDLILLNLKMNFFWNRRSLVPHTHMHQKFFNTIIS